MSPRRQARIAIVFAVQLVNSIVHHTTHMKPLFGSISFIDAACTLTLMVSLVYLGYQASQPPRRLLSGALWSLLLWIFGVCASATVMRLVDPASMDGAGLVIALEAALVLAPIALALGAAGAWRAHQLVAV